MSIACIFTSYVITILIITHIYNVIWQRKASAKRIFTFALEAGALCTVVELIVGIMSMSFLALLVVTLMIFYITRSK